MEQKLQALVGKWVLVMGVNYFYWGVLVQIDEHFIVLKDPFIVYETGAWDAKKFQDAQSMGVPEVWVNRGAVESISQIDKAMTV